MGNKKRKENKEIKPLGNCNVGRVIHGQGCCEPNKEKIVEDNVKKHVEGAWRFVLECYK